ncbi:Sodium/calcium exchanger protein-domain-containing protein [Xylariaceae sp. FL0016]|nr:Sodium/calcium exchanger protein-domain-containing protein [Xylariaceae sp. FL0016]
MSDEPSVNIFKQRNHAQRLGRSDSTGSAVWNPFRHFTYKSPKRANTLNDAEAGQARDPHHKLTQANTAPENLGAQHDRISPNSGDGDNADSQTTTVAANENGSLRKRGSATDNGEPKIGTAEDDDKKVKVHEPFTFKNQLQRTLFGSWINILLLAAPAGIAIWQAGVDGKIVFAVNFVAIIPLAAILSFCTEQIALRTGEVLGGLINATFGNAVELIVAIIALAADEVVVVQTSLVGSILSNLLLVLGMCFFCGGINRPEQFFNTTVAQTAASLLALAVASLIVPTVFQHTPDFADDRTLPANAVPQLSHGVAVILLFVYAAYLFFQLRTHSTMFSEVSQKVETQNLVKSKDAMPDNAVASGIARTGASHAGVRGDNGQAHNIMQHHDDKNKVDDDDDEPEVPELHFYVALATLIAATVIIALCAEGMVDGIEAITAEGVSEEFVGLILLPIVGNACEHATAVTVAVKDKMDLAIGVAIGSSMQVALFLIPLLVIIGWGMGNQDMTLAFDTFQVVVLFVSVLLVNYLIGDGKSHWLEGNLLICLYLIIAVCAWFYPNSNDASEAAA